MTATIDIFLPNKQIFNVLLLHNNIIFGQMVQNFKFECLPQERFVSTTGTFDINFFNLGSYEL